MHRSKLLGDEGRIPQATHCQSHLITVPEDQSVSKLVAHGRHDSLNLKETLHGGPLKLTHRYCIWQ